MTEQESETTGTRTVSSAHQAPPAPADTSRRIAGVPVPSVHIPRPRISKPPVSRVQVPRLRLSVPDARRVLPQIDPRSKRGRLLWVGGLGGLAVLDALEWPVAAAIAAGTRIAEQRARGYVHDQSASGGRPGSTASSDHAAVSAESAAGTGDGGSTATTTAGAPRTSAARKRAADAPSSTATPG
jgi:hypothetical protein